VAPATAALIIVGLLVAPADLGAVRRALRDPDVPDDD